jgi:hypothetical protein
MSRPAIRVHIERLVLEGVAPGDRAAVVAAFRAELGRRLAAHASTSAPAQPSGPGAPTAASPAGPVGGRVLARPGGAPARPPAPAASHVAPGVAVSAPAPRNAASAGRLAAAAVGRVITGTRP